MTQSPERQPEHVQGAGVQEFVPAQMAAWSTEEIKAELGRTIRDLEEARRSELAARTRSTEERTPESEVTLQMRREEVSRVHRRYIRLLDELEVRNESYP